MAWEDEAVPMLRVIIFDYEEPYNYTDEKLEQLLVVSASLVKQELGFTSYTISIADNSITPDPAESNDVTFINFIVLKAACLADQGSYRLKAALEGVRANLGPASLSVGGHLKGFLDLWEKGTCKSYEDLKNQYLFGNFEIHAIFSPFVGPKFDPSILPRYR